MNKRVSVYVGVIFSLTSSIVLAETTTIYYTNQCFQTITNTPRPYREVSEGCLYDKSNDTMTNAAGTVGERCQNATAPCAGTSTAQPQHAPNENYFDPIPSIAASEVVTETVSFQPELNGSFQFLGVGNAGIGDFPAPPENTGNTIVRCGLIFDRCQRLNGGESCSVELAKCIQPFTEGNGSVN